MNGQQDQTPGVVSGKSDDKGKATKPRTGRSKKSSGHPLGTASEGAPLHGRPDEISEEGQRAFNAAVRRVDASIARAIADAVDAALHK